MSMAVYSIIISLLVIPCISGAHTHPTPSHLVRSSCLHARYPTICLRTLSPYPAQTPTEVARWAVSISYHRAQKASLYLAQLKAQTGRTWAMAIRDCLDQISDAAAELGDTVAELREVRARNTGEFRWHMSNAETWVSAALTDQDTCLDGIGEGGRRGVADDVRRRIRNVAKVTSNALYLINRLGY